jgi:cytochrome c556
MAEAVSLTNARTVKLCQKMRIIQQMDAGVGSTDKSYLQRVLNELALGDPLRGVEPWDVASLGESAQKFLEFAKQVPGLTLSSEGNEALGLSLAEPTLEDTEATLVLAAKEHYRVVKPTQLRAGKDLDSEKTGQKLEKGEVIEVIETRDIPNPNREGETVKRVRIDDGTRTGWASTNSSKDGHAILEQISDEELPLAIAMSKTDLTKLEEKIWQNFLDSLEKADKKHSIEQKKRAISSKATTMSKEPYHKKLSQAVELAKKGGFTPDEMQVIHTAYMIEGHMDGGVWCKVQFDASRVAQ